MTPSRSFDRAADFYDQTRPLPEPAASLGIEAILKATGPAARILDAGTGTGRISIPLVHRGADLVGLDLSERMLRRLLSKSPGIRLVRSDAARIPFPRDHFDAVLTVHVLHLVSEWRQALREFKRILKPGGAYLDIKTYETVQPSARREVRKSWYGLLSGHGFENSHPGVTDRADLRKELEQLGADPSDVEVSRYIYQYSLQEEYDRFQSRIYSDTWDVPEPLFTESLRELHPWMVEQFGDLNEIRQEEVSFNIDIFRF